MTAVQRGPGETIWGGAAEKANGLSKPIKAENEDHDEECSICFDRKVTIRFQPCKHGACSDCVEQLRRQVIFKADKGLECPYCRQFIQGYALVGSTGDSKAKQKLKEANAAAKAGAIARLPQQKKVTDQVAKPQETGGWECPKCKNKNFSSRKVCNRCNQVAPSHVLHAMLMGTKQAIVLHDPLKASRKDVQDWATTKLHPNFNASFAECGMPFDSGSATLMGNMDSVKAALLKGGHKKLQHIFEQLLGDSFIPKLVFDFYGNFTLQDLLEAAGRMRAAVASLKLSKQLSAAQANSATGVVAGQDHLRRLAAEISTVSTKAITHEKGNYVLEKVIDTGEAADILPVARMLAKRPYDFVHHKYAVMKFGKAIERLALAAFDQACKEKEEVALFLDKLCETLLAEPGQFQRLLLHDLGGPMMLEAAQGGLPHGNAIQLLMRVARGALDLRGRSTGMNMLKKFLGLEARDAECRELFVTTVCIMADKLQGQYSDTVTSLVDGCEIIQRMLELLAQEADSTCQEWAAVIVEDLVDHAQDLFSGHASKDLLINAIQTPGDPDPIPARLKMIYIRNGAAFYRQVATAVNPDEPPFDFVEPQRVEENKSPPDRPVKPVPMVRKKRGLPPGFAATVNREPTSASPENETPDPFPQPAAEAIPMFKEVPSTKFGENSPIAPGSSASFNYQPEPVSFSPDPAALAGPPGAQSQNGSSHFQFPPPIQNISQPKVPIYGHVITPIHKKEKPPEPAPMPKIADLLSVSQPMGGEEPDSRSPRGGNPPRPLGQPVKKTSVPRAAQDAQNGTAEDFLATLLPGLSLESADQAIPKQEPSSAQKYKPPSQKALPSWASPSPKERAVTTSQTPDSTQSSRAPDVNNEPKARVMTGGPSVHKAAASNPAEPEKRKLSSRQRMVWDDFTPPTSSNPEPPTPIPPSSASGGSWADPPVTEADQTSWQCPVCTFKHEGAEAGYLTCAVCNTVRP